MGKYRNFKIKYVTGQDDYACMKEVISRRIERGISQKDNKSNDSFLPFPDLILLDGGIGHVDSVIPVLKSYNLDKSNQHQSQHPLKLQL